MKDVLVLCLFVILFGISRGIDGQMLLHPLARNQIAPAQPKHPIPPPSQNPKKIYLTNVVQWDCLKRNNIIRSENRPPFKILNLSQTSKLRNEGSNRQNPRLSNIRPNYIRRILPMRRRYFPRPRIVYIPPHSSIIRKRLNSTHYTNKFIPNNNIKIIKSQPKVTTTAPDNKKIEKIELREEKAEVKNPKIIPNISTTPKNKPPLSSTTAQPQRPNSHFLYRPKPSSVKPYEVQEVVEEEVSFDVKENDNAESADANWLGRKEIEKHQDSNDVIKDSITAVLKSLITPMTTQPREVVQKKVVPSTGLESNAPQFFPALLNDRSPKIVKDQIDNEVTTGTAKQINLIATEELHKVNEKPTEASTKDTINENENNTAHDITTEYQKNAPTTEASIITKTDATTDSEQKMEETNRSFELNDINLSNLLRNLVTDPQTTVVFVTTKATTTTTTNEPSTTDESSPSQPTTQGSTKPTEYYTDTSVNESDLTPRNFQEFTDHPMTIDLLTTLKTEWRNDQDGKNSRKMHFKETPETTTSVTQQTEEQRRSDILISDNLGDYVDLENDLSDLKYLEDLKQNNWNTTIDAIVPHIPLIINDLRESKIPPEDTKHLSEVFGKHWTPFLVLVNKTNFDMLPLMKMKNEDDLKNILQSVSPDTLEPTTTKTEENTNNKTEDEYESYDYLQEYKEFYQDLLGEELKEETKVEKPRTKRNVADDFRKTMEATEEYFNSIAEENSNYYDNAVYDGDEENQSSSVFEIIMEVSDYDINLDNKSDLMT